VEDVQRVRRGTRQDPDPIPPLPTNLWAPRMGKEGDLAAALLRSPAVPDWIADDCQSLTENVVDATASLRVAA